MKPSLLKVKEPSLPTSSHFFEMSVEWIEKWGKFVLLGISSLLLLLLLLQSFGPKSTPQITYQTAHTAKERLQKGETLQDGDLSRLLDTLSSHRELLPLYQGTLLQSFIADNELNHAPSDIRNAPFSVAGLFPWRDFGAIALLIADNQYEEALSASKTLHSLLLERAKKEESSIFAWNLLRIAALEAKLGNLEGQKAAWQEIAQYVEGNGENKIVEFAQNGFLNLAPFFQEGEVSFASWIQKMTE